MAHSELRRAVSETKLKTRKLWESNKWQILNKELVLDKTVLARKLVTELKEQFPSLERGEMSLEEYQAGRDEAIKDFIMKLREMGITDDMKIRELVMKQFGENRASGGRAGYQEGGVTQSRV